MTTALVLAGHGSHISSETAATVWRHVDRLRAWGVADEIAAVFWKEPPSFRDTWRLVTADDITLVPVFTARGYFTQTVIPNELGLTGAVTERNGRTMRYARTLGEHPVVADLIQRRVTLWLARNHVANPRESVAVAIIGHSTKLNNESRKATEKQANALRTANLVSEVVAVYLDDLPAIADVYHLTSASTLVVVPYFIAEGSHVLIDIPESLGLSAGQTIAPIQDRMVHYLPPVGADESLTDAILDLARETGGLFEKTRLISDHDRLRGNDNNDCWGRFPRAGADLLTEMVRQMGHLQFGQLSLMGDVVRPTNLSNTENHSTLSINTPDQLRSVVRGMVNGGTFRPLPTTRDLPGDWYVPLNSPSQLAAVVETVYPGTVTDWATYASGQLTDKSVESLKAVTARQTGRLRELAGLSSKDTDGIVENVCSHCVRQPIWHQPPSSEDDRNDNKLTLIPCTSPCSWWLDSALHATETPV